MSWRVNISIGPDTVSGDRVVPSVVEAVCTEGSMADARVRITYGSSLSKPSVSSIICHETGARWRLRRLVEWAGVGRQIIAAEIRTRSEGSLEAYDRVRNLLGMDRCRRDGGTGIVRGRPRRPCAPHGRPRWRGQRGTATPKEYPRVRARRPRHPHHSFALTHGVPLAPEHLTKLLAAHRVGHERERRSGQAEARPTLERYRYRATGWTARTR